MDNKGVLHHSSTNINEIIARIKGPDTALVILFYGAEVDYRILEKAMNGAKVPYLGCMDVGRLTSGKYLLDEKSIVAMSFSKDIAEKVAIDSVNMETSRPRGEITGESAEKLKAAAKKIAIDLSNPDMERDFAINLAFGLNSANPFLAGQSQAGLMLQTAGGSSGGKLDFAETNVISSAGSGHVAAFALVKLSKEYKFTMDRISSFEDVKGKILKVTRLESERHVLELNGKPAAAAYAEAIGITPDRLAPDHFAEYTLGLEPGDGERLITSIMKKDEGMGLLTYNDVVDGTQFQIFKAVSQKNDRTRGLGKLKGLNLAAFLSFDCVLCYLARNNQKEVDAIASVYEKAMPGVPKVGFGTFSENICGANINQTETYLAIYRA